MGYKPPEQANPLLFHRTGKTHGPFVPTALRATANLVYCRLLEQGAKSQLSSTSKVIQVHGYRELSSAYFVFCAMGASSNFHHVNFSFPFNEDFFFPCLSCQIYRRMTFHFLDKDKPLQES